MTKLLMSSIAAAVALLGCTTLSAQRQPSASPPFAPVPAGSLFASNQPLDIELEAPLADLIAKKSLGFPKYKEASVAGKLSYFNDQNKKIEIPVEINIKGFSTSSFCPFPKFEFKFKTPGREETLFAAMPSVDFNTHCGEESDSSLQSFFKASIYNHREALVYRMAEILEIPTLKARPVFVRYKSTQIPSVDQSQEAYRAFFLEDMGGFRKRLNAKEVKGIDDPLKSLKIAQKPGKESQYVFNDVQSSPQVDPEDAARIALFQALIGNGDWFIKARPLSNRFQDDRVNLWNTKIVELPTGKWVLFPQDFSVSGIMLGHPTSGVVQEVFSLVDKSTQQNMKEHFVVKKPELYKLLETLTKDPKGRETMQKTLDSFYMRIESY